MGFGGLQREFAVDLGQGVPGDCPGICGTHDIHVVSLVGVWWVLIEGSGV